MKRITFLLAVMIMLTISSVQAQDFDAWLGTWDVEMYYQMLPLQDRMVWIIDNATNDAASGIDELSGAEIVITWDDSNQKYVFGTFLITLSNNSFQGYLSDFKEITMKGKQRPPDAGDDDDDDDNNGDEPDGPCPVSILLEDKPQAINLLQRFRDEILAPAQTGRMIIGLYYDNGKLLCNMLKASSQFRQTCRVTLLSFLPFIEQIYDNNVEY